jgi:CheY-like chemotaxis protein
MRKIMLVIDDYKELVALENLLRRLGFDVLSLGKDILVPDALLRFHPEIVVASAKGKNVDGIKVATRAKKHSPSPRVAITYSPSNTPVMNAEAKSVIDALITVPIQAHGLIKVISQLANLDPGPLIGKYQKLTSKSLDAEGDAANQSAYIQGPSPGEEQSKYVQSTPPAPAARGGESLRPDSRIFPPPSAYKPADKAAEKASEKAADLTSAKQKNQLSQVSIREPLHTPPEEDPWSVPQPAEWDPVKTPSKAATLRTQRSDRYDQFLRDKDDGPVSGVMSREKAAQAMRQLKIDSEKEKDELDRIDEEKRQFAKAMFEDKDKK